MNSMTRETIEDFCPNCEDYRTLIPVKRDESYTVRGEEITVTVDRMLCEECGESIGTDEQDQAVLDVIHSEYRRRMGLLSPQEIKGIHERYRLSQKSFAVLLGMGEATINRYEKGCLQDQMHDTAIRACQNPSVMLDILNLRGHLLTDWQRERAQSALTGQQEGAGNLQAYLQDGDCVCMPMERSDRTGYRLFDYERFARVVIWFCSQLRDVSRTTINKLTFYADYVNYRNASVSLTGTAYRRIKLGPVPADFDGLLCRMEFEGLLVREEREFPGGYVGHYYKPGPNADSVKVVFDEREQGVLEHVGSILGRLSATAISAKSHEETAWLETADGQLISYDHAMSLSLSLPDSQ